MAESAALLVDEVFPEQPVRQWVLSVPHPLRFLFASRPDIMGAVLGIVYRVIATHLIGKAGFSAKRAHTGAVTLIQRFGSALNLNLHFHMLFLDGVYVERADGTLSFRWVKAPTSAELTALAGRIAHRVGRFLERQGLLECDAQNTCLADLALDEEPMQGLPTCSSRVKRGERRNFAPLSPAFAQRKGAPDPHTSCREGSNRAFILPILPVTVVKRLDGADNALERVLWDNELRGYISALNILHPAIGSFLRVALLLGGQRMSQLLRATWDDYDPNRRVLVLIDGKGRGDPRVHQLPISEAVAAVLERLRAINSHGPLIFSTTGGLRMLDLPGVSAHVSEIAAAHTDKGKDRWTARDLRRAAETRLAALGVSKDHRAQLLSHGRERNVQDRHYDKHNYLPEKATALTKWEAHLEELISEKVSNVVHARFQRRRHDEG